MKKIKLSVPTLSRETAAAFETAALAVSGVKRVDTWDKRAVIEAEFDDQKLITALSQAGFEARLEEEPAVTREENCRMNCSIGGMHCRSCEIIIERKLRKLPRVSKVEADAGKGTAIIHYQGAAPTVDELQRVLSAHGYTVKSAGGASTMLTLSRPSLWELVGLFALVLLVGQIMSKLGLFKFDIASGAAVGLGAAFVIGLVAASSSCIAVSGGLLLSSAAKYNERFGGLSPGKRMKPVIYFVVGRLVSYAVLGGVIGLIGKALSPSPLVTGIISMAAALYMLIMGLEMLRLAPTWLKRLLPRMPKTFSRLALAKEDSASPAAPFTLGALTFFLPCGFTQALQLYALTTGSFEKSAGVLLAFALGTAPALLALGWASSSLKGRAGRLFYRFSGALVIVLAITNMRNGLTLAGFNFSLPTPSQTSAAAAAPNIVMDGDKQVIKMTVDGDYEPDVLTVKAGVPVRWEVNGVDVRGCISSLVSRQLGISRRLQQGINIFEFTAPTPGKYAFSCSMGMFRGVINAI